MKSHGLTSAWACALVLTASSGFGQASRPAAMPGARAAADRRTLNDGEPIMQYECHEANYGLRILSAARAEERSTAGGR